VCLVQVLGPLCDVAPGLVHPEKRATVQELLASLLASMQAPPHPPLPPPLLPWEMSVFDKRLVL
jgi:hypothetical protein